MLEMTHHFVIAFERVGGGSDTLEAHIERVADALHGESSVFDAAIGANLVAGTVEFELGARGMSTGAALDVAWGAVLRAIKAGGGAVIDAFHAGQRPTEQIDTDSDALEQWQQTRTELANAHRIGG